jgi:hypothetical protein
MSDINDRCIKKRYSQIGAMLQLAILRRKSRFARKGKEETQSYYCKECKSHHLTSQKKKGK